jgi:tRNA A37 threonylcarbamoyladenosine synthetase subunit TsaC/SUA5/YrdC
MRESVPVENGNITAQAAQRAAEILLSSGQIVLPTDSGYMRAVHLFHAEAISQLRASCAQETIPIALLATAEHVEALAAQISADARIVVRRLTPGPLAIALTASALIPAAAHLPGGRVALCLPKVPAVVQVADRLGAPLLGVPCSRDDLGSAVLLDAGELPPAQPTVLDMTQRPARILQAGAPERAILERIVLLEE